MIYAQTIKEGIKCTKDNEIVNEKLGSYCLIYILCLENYFLLTSYELWQSSAQKKAIKIKTSSKSFTSKIMSDGGFPAWGNNKGEFLRCFYSRIN